MRKFTQEHRDKIKKALKKAWKSGKFKEAFGRPIKKASKIPEEARAFEVSYRTKEIGPKVYFEIILENGTTIWTPIEAKRIQDFLKRLRLAMRYGFPIESMDYGTDFYFSNEEGPTFNCLNGSKIIGYRF